MNIGSVDVAMYALFIKEYIKRIKEETGDNYVSLSVMSTADGSVLMYDSKDPAVDNKSAGTYQFGIMKSVALGVKKMENEKDRKQEIYEITITYEGQKHILALSDTRKFMVHLILKDTANIALVKNFMEKTTNYLVQELAKKAGKESVKRIDFTEYHNHN